MSATLKPEILEELRAISSFLQRGIHGKADVTPRDDIEALSSSGRQGTLQNHAPPVSDLPRLDDDVHSTEKAQEEIKKSMLLLQRSIELNNNPGNPSPEAHAAFVEGQASFQACVKKHLVIATPAFPGNSSSAIPTLLSSLLQQEGNDYDVDRVSQSTSTHSPSWFSQASNLDIITTTDQAKNNNERAGTEESMSIASFASWAAGFVPQDAGQRAISNIRHQVTVCKDDGTLIHEDPWIREYVGTTASRPEGNTQTVWPSQVSYKFHEPRSELPVGAQNDSKRKKGNDHNAGAGNNRSF